MEASQASSATVIAPRSGNQTEARVEYKALCCVCHDLPNRRNSKRLTEMFETVDARIRLATQPEERLDWRRNHSARFLSVWMLWNWQRGRRSANVLFNLDET